MFKVKSHRDSRLNEQADEAAEEGAQLPDSEIQWPGRPHPSPFWLRVRPEVGRHLPLLNTIPSEGEPNGNILRKLVSAFEDQALLSRGTTFSRFLTCNPPSTQPIASRIAHLPDGPFDCGPA